MKCIILAAGMGSRLKPFTYGKPKPMLPIIDKPVLEHLLNHLVHFNITDIYINLHYKGDTIKEYFKNGEGFGVSITWREQVELNGPAGAILSFSDLLEEDKDILIISGDAVHDANIKELINQHREKSSLLTVLMKEVSDPSGYGMGILDSDGKLLKFIEKPIGLDSGKYTVSCGIYCMNTSLIKKIPHGKVSDFVDLVNLLIKEKEQVYGHKTDCYWIDMGTPENLLRSNLEYLQREINRLVPAVEPNEQVFIKGGAKIHPSATIVGPVFIGEDCLIGEGVHIIGPAVIGTCSIIERGCHVRQSVLLNGSILSEGTIIFGALYSSIRGVKS